MNLHDFLHRTFSRFFNETTNADSVSVTQDVQNELVTENENYALTPIEVDKDDDDDDDNYDAVYDDSENTYNYVPESTLEEQDANYFVSIGDSEQPNCLAHTPADTVIIYKSELDYISRCILDYKTIETGGQLFGYWTTNGVPVVMYVIGPGKNANHQSAFFNQDLDYLTSVGQILIDTFGLQHIGEWHSHHQLGLASPSQHDAKTMVDGIQRGHLGQFLLCIGNCTPISSTFNAFNFTEYSGYDYVHAQWRVKSIDSPFRSIIDSALKNMLIHPQCKIANDANVYENVSTSVEYKKGYWFDNKKNRETFKRIYDWLSMKSSVLVQMDENQFVHLTITKKNMVEKILFPEHFPSEPPIISREENGKERSILGDWQFHGDIFESFVKYYKRTREL